MKQFGNIITYLSCHSIRWLLLIAVIVCSSSIRSQTLDDAESAYRNVILMYNSADFTKDTTYQQALACGRMYQRILRQTPRNADQYAKCLSRLKEIVTIMQNAASYHSQLRQDSAAIVYAREAIDISMMKEMSNQGLRQASNYSNLLMFTISRMYNTAVDNRNNVPLLRGIIKYMNEYLTVTDSTMYQRIAEPMQAVKRMLTVAQYNKKDYEDVYTDVPDFDVFARQSIEKGMEKWKQKDPYETMGEYKERVTEETARKKQKELQDTLLAEYVERFSHPITNSDLRLSPYDADHQSFLIGSPYGNMVLVVPRSNNQARLFAEQWNNVKVTDPRFVIVNKKLTLAGLSFVTPAGKTYTYDSRQQLAWNETKVDVNFTEGLVDVSQLNNSDGTAQNIKIGVQEVAVGVSDVDINIPESKKVNDKTFAVIISNENYTLVPQVPLAAKDGDSFATYCQKTLGLPKENILIYPDATYGKMIRAVQDIRNIADALPGLRIIFFYAGHGLPNETTHDAYLMPVDADGTATEVCYPLRKLYNELSSISAESVIVFLDACFSGTTADGSSLMASARGVSIKANQENPSTGNLVAFSAASNDETAYPYTERQHGLFTYYLLKKLQESKGNATLGELSDYIIENVRLKSALINHKTQTPHISYSPSLSQKWRKMKMK